MRQLLIYCGIFFCIASIGDAQVVGGTAVFEFLTLPASPRLSGLGGHMPSVQDADQMLALSNPALLNPKAHQQIDLNHSFHLLDGQFGYAGYARHYEPWQTTFHAGVQYIDYGDFKLTNEIGTVDGEFNASEVALHLAGARQLYDKLSVGASVKLINSKFEGYGSFGAAVDLGAFYQDTTGRFGVGLVFKNLGYQFSPFDDGNREELPVDVQIGISQRLKHLPFRIGIVAHDLHRWNILYDDPNTPDNDILTDFNTNPEDSPVADFFDNFFRHLIFNGEFLFGERENFTIQFGYNHQRRKELTVSYATRSLAGFSFGLGIRIKRFRVGFGHQFYHLAGGSSHISITTDLKRW